MKICLYIVYFALIIQCYNFLFEAQLLSNQGVTHRPTHPLSCSGHIFVVWIDLNVLYGFATKNLIRKSFLMVSWHIPVFLVGWLNFKWFYRVESFFSIVIMYILGDLWVPKYKPLLRPVSCKSATNSSRTS